MSAVVREHSGRRHAYATEAGATNQTRRPDGGMTVSAWVGAATAQRHRSKPDPSAPAQFPRRHGGGRGGQSRSGVRGWVVPGTALLSEPEGLQPGTVAVGRVGYDQVGYNQKRSVVDLQCLCGACASLCSQCLEV